MKWKTNLMFTKNALIRMERKQEYSRLQFIIRIIQKWVAGWGKGTRIKRLHWILIAVDHFEKWKTPLHISIHRTKASYLYLHFPLCLRLKSGLKLLCKTLSVNLRTRKHQTDRSYPLLILKYSKAGNAVVHCVQRKIWILNFIRHIICSGRGGTVTLSD